jgi:tetratricopeptide (TPR) repeat protein
MRKSLIITILLYAFLFLSYKGYSQHHENFRQIDSLTYSYFAAGNWDELIRTGKKSIQSGTDYYYLRMRMGWAFYSQHKYRLAAEQYEHALKFNSNNADALKLLIASYELSNRKSDAITLRKMIHAESNPELFKRYSGIIKEFSFFLTHSRSATSEIISEFNDNFNATQDGLQKISRSFYYPGVGLSHKFFSNNLILEHRAGYLAQNEFSYFVTNRYEIVNNDQNLSQFDYSVALHISPVRGFKIIPGAFISSFSIPVYAVTANPGRNKGKPSDYVSGNSHFMFLKVHKEFGYFSAAVSAGNGKINFLTTQQATLHLKIYPFANLNLYYALNASTQKQEALDDEAQYFIHQHKLGFKLFKNLWIEAETTQGKINSFYDLDSYIMYNGLETLGKSYGIRCIIPHKNSRLQYLIGLMHSKTSSGFIPDSAPLSYTNQLIYPTFNITGGITWKL